MHFNCVATRCRVTLLLNAPLGREYGYIKKVGRRTRVTAAKMVDRSLEVAVGQPDPRQSILLNLSFNTASMLPRSMCGVMMQIISISTMGQHGSRWHFCLVLTSKHF